MQKYNISKPTEYEKNGEKKTKWDTVGTLTEFEKDGKVSRVIEIPTIGLRAQAFEIPQAKAEGNGTQEDVKPEDIPF